MDVKNSYKERVIGTVIGLLIVGGLLVGLRFFLGGEKGSWVCEDGNWVKQGNPSEPAPTTGCEPVVHGPQFIDPSSVATEDLSLDKARLTRDKAGMKPGVWYLRFDLPEGYTWFEVSFADEAECFYDSEKAACESLYPPSGARTSFLGKREGDDKFVVSRLEVVPR